MTDTLAETHRAADEGGGCNTLSQKGVVCKCLRTNLRPERDSNGSHPLRSACHCLVSTDVRRQILTFKYGL